MIIRIARNYFYVSRDNRDNLQLFLCFKL